MSPFSTNSAAAGALRIIERARRGKALLGMVHLAPLPGAPLAAGAPAAERVREAAALAIADAIAIVDGGMDGIVIENFGDTPFPPVGSSAATVAAMTAIVERVVAALDARRGERPLLAINVLRNDAAAALGIAAACGLDGIRVNVHAGAMVTDQGIIEGRAHETLRERARLAAPVAILADVLVKHAAPLGGGGDDDETAAALARDTARRGLADALIVTGAATGAGVDLSRLRAVRAAVPEAALLAGSGVTPDTVAELLSICDGCIVGTALKSDGDARRPVDPRRVDALVRRARGGR